MCVCVHVYDDPEHCECVCDVLRVQHYKLDAPSVHTYEHSLCLKLGRYTYWEGLATGC